jgi:hypothetical protein
VVENDPYRLLPLDGDVRILRGVCSQLEPNELGAVVTASGPFPTYQMASETADVCDKRHRQRTGEVFDLDLLTPLGKPRMQRH